MNSSRLIALVLLLTLVAWSTQAQDEEPATDLIELSLGYGFGFPGASGLFLDTGSGGIEQGVITEDLIKRVFIQRELAERIFLDLDYDSDRQGGFFEGDNVYSLQYRGPEDDFLQEISAGNRSLSIPGTRLLTIDEGSASSYALAARMGTDRFRMQGLVRYSQALSGKKRFRGGSQLVEAELLDVSYVKRRFFLIPDRGIYEPSLQLLRSTDAAADGEISGRNFAVLVRGQDYRFDNTKGWIYLNRSLGEEQELLVYYEQDEGGASVGSSSLGQLAIIDETGTRVDFNETDFPDYFDTLDFRTGGSKTCLYLRRQEFNSYWENKAAYYLPEVYGGVFPQNVSITLRSTPSGERNRNYDVLLDSYVLDPGSGTIIFVFEDGYSEFYPRPFPGEYPFTHATDPVNPFDPANPIYGGTEDPVADVSVNTLLLRYAVDQDSYFLDFDIIEGSIRVSVDGKPLSPVQYTVDSYSGTITFAEGVIGPTSDIEVTYRYAPLIGGNQELLLALGLDYDLEWLKLRNLTTFSYPLSAPVPLVGEERSSVLGNSTDLTIYAGSGFADGELTAELKAGAAFALTRGNHKGEAVVAAMEEDRRLDIDLAEDEWMPASVSRLLPAEGISLGDRGDLLYENYWDGDELRDVSWDNSGNPAFTYAQKAGPYNSADRYSSVDEHSLVLDFDFSSGLNDAFVSSAGAFASTNLLDYSRFHMILRGEQIAGDDVQVYVELLRVYQEDLDGDNALDTEVSRDQPGFSLAPQPGSATTIIGSDRFGNGNGRIDSEDVNGNGVLDPPGDYATDEERGVVIVLPNSAAELVTLSPGDDEWKFLSIDMQELISSSKSSLEAAQAVRVTVKPVTSPTAGSVSGKVLIGRIWFSSSGITNDSPDYLNLREDSTEQVLRCTFDPAGSPSGSLARGEAASLSRRFGYLADFSMYREFRMNLYLPAAETVPAGAELTLQFIGSAQDGLAAAMDGSGFQPGWNEIVVELEAPYTLRVNGSPAGALVSSGAVNVLRRVSEVRFGILATPATPAPEGITDGFEFWLDEWLLAESRYAFDASAYVEAKADYSGDLLKVKSYPILSDIAIQGGFEHREGHFLETTGEQRNAWFAGADATLMKFFPVGVDLSGYGESTGGLFEQSEQVFPGGYEERNKSRSYAHLIGVDSGIDYLPALEHRYSRSVGDAGEIGLSDSGYLFDLETTTRESLSVSEAYGFPKGFEQSYSYIRSWLYRDRESLLIDTPPSPLESSLNLSVNQRHAGTVSYSWERNFTSLDLSRDDAWILTDAAPPSSLFSSYAERMKQLFHSVESLYPAARLETRKDDGSFSLILPRLRFVGASLNTHSIFLDRLSSPGTGGREVSLENILSLSVPFSPRGKGILELTPGITRSCHGVFGTDGGPASPGEEFRLLGQGWRILLMPPFYYLNPRLSRGRLNEYEAVDLLAESSAFFGADQVNLETALSLDARLLDPPWYLPARGNVELAGETGREGESYTQSRTISVGLGRDFILGRGRNIGANRLSLDAGWESGWDYTHKVVSHTLSVDTALDLRVGIGGRLGLDHNLSITGERQRLGDEALLLFPGQPGEEAAVPFQPDKNSLSSTLGLEYFRERAMDPRRRELLSASRMIAGGLEKEVGRISHRDRLELENNFLDILNAERTELGNTTTVPLRLLYTHDTVMTVSQYMDLELTVKTVGGVEEIITTDPEGVDYIPALGFELRLTAVLNF